MKQLKKSKLLCLILVSLMLILVGCGTTPYVDPNPDEVAIRLDSGDVTYEGYRLYLDVSEEIAEITARENLAFTFMLEKDLTDMDFPPDAEAYRESADVILDNYFENPLTKMEIDYIRAYTGLSEEQIRESMWQNLWSQYLEEAMYGIYSQLAGSTIANTGDGEATLSADELYAIYLEGYYERFEFNSEENVVTIDGVDYPFTQEYHDYIEYSGAANRVGLLSDITNKVAIQNDMEANGKTADMTGFDDYAEETLEAMSDDPVIGVLIRDILSDMNVSWADYEKGMDKMFRLNYAWNSYTAFVQQDYDSLPAESKPESVEIYYDEYSQALLESMELVTPTT